MSDTTPDVDPVAVAALASIILERVADATSDSPALAGGAVAAMETETGLSLDVCAGVLLACSTIMGAGSVTPDVIAGLAVAVDPSEVASDAG